MNSDLNPKTVIPGPDSCWKNGEDDAAFVGIDLVELVQYMVLRAVLRPFFPILSPIFVSFCSDTIGNFLPRNQEIICDARFFVTIYSCHDCVCGKGKLRLK